MKPRPQSVACVSLDVGNQDPLHGQSWCGRKDVYHSYEEKAAKLDELQPGRRITAVTGDDWIRVTRSNEWIFTGATHALTSARHKDALLICPECSAAMRAALFAGTYRPEGT